MKAKGDKILYPIKDKIKIKLKIKLKTDPIFNATSVTRMSIISLDTNLIFSTVSIIN